MKKPLLTLILMIMPFVLFGYLLGSKRNEPKIIFTDEKGNTITKEDLKGATGEVNYEIIGNNNVAPGAYELHQRGRDSGGKGNYDEAIQFFNQAHELAPNWPYPVYDLAYTYLLKKDYQNALLSYELTDKLSPKGFFTCKTALWTLKKEQAGDFPQGLYTAYVLLESVDNPGLKLSILKQMTEKNPGFAPGWKELSSLLDDNNERMAAIDKGLQSNPDMETEGNLLINKAYILNVTNKKDEAIKILSRLISDENSTLGTRESAKLSLSLMTK